MRSEPEIRAMRDEAERVILRRGGEADRAAFTILDWVCDPHTITGDVVDLLDGPDPHDPSDEDPDAGDVLYALPLVVRSDDADDAKDYLYRVGERTITELAAAARRLDRLCKAELKKRNTPK